MKPVLAVIDKGRAISNVTPKPCPSGARLPKDPHGPDRPVDHHVTAPKARMPGVRLEIRPWPNAAPGASAAAAIRRAGPSRIFAGCCVTSRSPTSCRVTCIGLSQLRIHHRARAHTQCADVRSCFVDRPPPRSRMARTDDLGGPRPEPVRPQRLALRAPCLRR